MIKQVLAACLVTFALPTLAEAKGPKHCPPGLAKKTPACVPPGQAQKDARANDLKGDDGAYDASNSDILRTGDIVQIDGQDYIIVDTDRGPVLRRGDDLFRLPRYDDSDYVRIGDALIRVDRRTKNFLEWIRLTDLILS